MERSNSIDPGSGRRSRAAFVRRCPPPPSNPRPALIPAQTMGNRHDPVNAGAGRQEREASALPFVAENCAGRHLRGDCGVRQQRGTSQQQGHGGAKRQSPAGQPWTDHLQLSDPHQYPRSDLCEPSQQPLWTHSGTSWALGKPMTELPLPIGGSWVNAPPAACELRIGARRLRPASQHDL